MYDTILVATDGSDSANRALEQGLNLAGQYDATLHVISVVDTKRYGEPALSSAELVIEDLEDRAHDELADIEDRADNYGIEVMTKSCHGNPHDEIVVYADDIDADAILLGQQGISESHHIGSVANRVVKNTDRTVVLA